MCVCVFFKYISLAASTYRFNFKCKCCYLKNNISYSYFILKYLSVCQKGREMSLKAAFPGVLNKKIVRYSFDIFI